MKCPTKTRRLRGFSSPALLLMALTAGSAAMAANTPPTTSVGSYTYMWEDGSVDYGFSVGDVETAPENLQVTVTSSNPALIDNASLQVQTGTTSNSRWLGFRPLPDSNGQTTLRFTVTDADGGSTIKDLVLDVLPVNDAPSIVIGSSRVHATGASGLMVGYGFASDIHPGPDDEFGQWVDFETTVQSDPGGILTSALLNQNGDLEYGLSGNPGEAILGVVAVDDGGTERQGNDRGLPQWIHIAVGDGVDLVAKIRREDNYTPGAPTANYLIEVMNNGPIDVTGVSLKAMVRYGLTGVSWTCTVPDSVCSTDAGTGVVNVLVDLPAGSTATVNLVGSLDPMRHFLRIDSWTAPPDGTPRLLPFDDQRVFIEAIDGIGLFKDGLE